VLRQELPESHTAKQHVTVQSDCAPWACPIFGRRWWGKQGRGQAVDLLVPARRRVSRRAVDQYCPIESDPPNLQQQPSGGFKFQGNHRLARICKLNSRKDSGLFADQDAISHFSNDSNAVNAEHARPMFAQEFEVVSDYQGHSALFSMIASLSASHTTGIFSNTCCMPEMLASMGASGRAGGVPIDRNDDSPHLVVRPPHQVIGLPPPFLQPAQHHDIIFRSSIRDFRWSRHSRYRQAHALSSARP